VTLQPDPWSTGDESTAYSQLFEQAVEKARQVITDAVTKFNEVVQRIHDKAWMIRPALGYVQGQLKLIGDGLAKVVQLVQYAMNHQTPVVSLIVQSFNWLDDVKKPMSGILSDIPVVRNEDFGKWRGEAATVYAGKVTAQKAAITDVTAKAEFISAWLFKIAKDNVAYMTELAKIGGEILAHIGTLAVKAGTIVGIPFAVDDIADMVGKAISTGINSLLGIAQKFVDTLEDVRNLKSELAELASLPNGAWPQAVRG
jgi:hypothetical protein